MQSEFINENVQQRVKKFWREHLRLGEVNFLDIETTGLSPLVHEILEIGILKIDKEGKISVFNHLIKPRGIIPPENERIHGINYAMVKNAPMIEDIFPECLKFLGKGYIIGHNVQFDCGFLLSQAILQKQTLQCNEVYDTCLFSRQVAKKTKRHPQNHKLSTLKQLYIKNSEDLLSHRALSDSLISLQVFMKLVHLLENNTDFEKLFFEKSFLYKFQNEFDIGEELMNTIGMCDIEKEYLFSSLKDNRPLYISYAGGSHGEELRPIRPVALLPTHKHLVLHAECLKTHQMRNFKLKLIKKIASSGFSHA